MSDVPVQPESGQQPRPDLTVPIDHVSPNPDQPRRSFDDEKLEELASSIASRGIIQPLIVREKEAGSKRYEIVAGERRWRAAQRVPLHEVPVIVRDFNDTEVLEVAIIENIQRADLNPVDEAAGYRQLMEKFGHTQAELATALGKSRPHITNLTRLLTLPDDVLELLRHGKISAGHGRALVGHEKAADLARQIVSKGLSVRDVEKLVKRSGKDDGNTGRSGGDSRKSEKDADTRALEDELSAQLKMRVSIDPDKSGESGRLSVSYKNFEQLDDLIRVLSGN